LVVDEEINRSRSAPARKRIPLVEISIIINLLLLFNYFIGVKLHIEKPYQFVGLWLFSFLKYIISSREKSISFITKCNSRRKDGGMRAGKGSQKRRLLSGFIASCVKTGSMVPAYRRAQEAQHDFADEVRSYASP